MRRTGESRTLVVDSDDEDAFLTLADATQQPPQRKRSRPTCEDDASTAFSPRAAVCAEHLLTQQASAKTPHERLSLLRRVGRLGGPYGECLKGSPGFSMWIRHVELNRAIIAETERFLSEQQHEATGTGSCETQRLYPERSVPQTKPGFALATPRGLAFGCCQPLPPARSQRSPSSARSTTPGATDGREDTDAVASNSSYELSAAERCALSLFATQSESGTHEQPDLVRQGGLNQWRAAPGAFQMTPSSIYEDSGEATGAHTIDRLKKPKRTISSSYIEQAADQVDDTCAVPSLAGTVIETQIAKSQREWLEWSRAVTLCPY